MVNVRSSDVIAHMQLLLENDPAVMLLARFPHQWDVIVGEVERLRPELGAAMAAGVVLAKLEARKL